MRRQTFAAALGLLLFAAIGYSQNGTMTYTDYHNRGVERGRRADYEGAIADFTSSLALKSTPEAYFNRGLAHSLKPNPDLRAAIADFDQAIALNSNTAKYYTYRGMAWHNLKNHDGALADYDRAISLDPRQTLAYLNRGIIRRSRKDFGSAAADFAKAIEIDPDASGAYYERAVLRRSLKEYDGALADLDKYISLKPRDIEGYRLRAEVKLEKKDIEGALADYAKVIEIDPRDTRAYNSRAGILEYERRNSAAALAELTRATELKPPIAEAFANRGYFLHMSVGDHVGAIADFTRAIELDPRKAAHYKDRALARRALNRKQPLSVPHAEIMNDLNRAIELAPDKASYYVWRAEEHADSGEVDFAIADYSKAIQLEPSYWNYSDRGKFYYDMKRFEDALKDYQQAAKINPALGIFRVAEAYRKLGKTQEAIAAYRENIRLSGADQNVFRSGLADYLLELGDKPAAIQEVNDIVAASPNDWRSYAWRAEFYKKMGDLGQAIADYSNAINLDATVGWVFAHRGLALLQSGHDAEAEQDFKKAFELDPKLRENVEKDAAQIRQKRAPSRVPARRRRP